MILTAVLSNLLEIAAEAKVPVQATIEDDMIVSPEGIYLSAAEIVRARIGGTITVPGYIVSRGGRCTSGRPDDPDDYELVELHQSVNPLMAIADFLCEVVAARAAATVEKKSDAAFAAELAAEPG